MSENPTLYITRQGQHYSGAISPVTIMNRRYDFEWIDDIASYAWKAPSVQEANILLKYVVGTKMFRPGIWLGELPSIAPSGLPVARTGGTAAREPEWIPTIQASTATEEKRSVPLTPEDSGLRRQPPATLLPAQQAADSEKGKATEGTEITETRRNPQRRRAPKTSKSLKGKSL